MQLPSCLALGRSLKSQPGVIYSVDTREGMQGAMCVSVKSPVTLTPIVAATFFKNSSGKRRAWYQCFSTFVMLTFSEHAMGD